MLTYQGKSGNHCKVYWFVNGYSWQSFQKVCPRVFFNRLNVLETNGIIAAYECT